MKTSRCLLRQFGLFMALHVCLWCAKVHGECASYLTGKQLKRAPAIALADDLSGSPSRIAIYTISDDRIRFKSLNEDDESIDLTPSAWQELNLTFEKPVEFLEPEEMAYSQGVLYVNDPKARDVVAVKLPQGSSRIVYKYLPGETADSISISNRILAVGDSCHATYLIVDAKTSRVIASGQIPFVTSLSLDVDRLLYLDGPSNSLKFIALPSLRTGAVRGTSALSQDVLHASDRIESFAAQDGSVLLSTERGDLLLSNPNQDNAYHIQSLASETPTFLVLGSSHLMLIHPSEKKITLMSRPVPVEFLLTGSTPAMGDAFSKLYVKLAQLGRLETANTAVSESYRDLEEFVTTDPDIAPTHQSLLFSKALRADFSDVLCQLNPSKCRNGAQNLILNQRLDPSAIMRVPVTRVKPFQTPTDFPTTKGQLPSLLESRGFETIPSEYNGPPVGTIENTLQQNNLLFLKVPSADLRTGDLITLAKDGRPNRFGRIDRQCYEQSATTAPFVSFASTKRSQDYVSLVNEDSETIADNGLLLFTFDRPQVEHIDLAGTLESKCFAGFRKQSFIVTDAVRTMGATLTFVNRNILPKSLTNSFLEPKLDQTDPQRVHITKPFTVAFRAQPVPGQGDYEGTVSGTDSFVAAQRRAWVESTGLITLPSEGWTVQAWAYFRDFEMNSDLQTMLHGLQSQNPSLQIVLRPLFLAANEAEGLEEESDDTVVSRDNEPPWHTDFLKRLNENRSLIHYVSPDRPISSNVAIALIDNNTTLNFTHPDLRSAHWMPDENWGKYRCPLRNEDEQIVDAKDEVDHATFIASMLVGQCEPDRGMVPDIRIKAIDLTSPSNMLKDLFVGTDAILQQKNRLWIINVSNAIKITPSLEEKLGLLKTQEQDWDKSLVVVASGNDGMQIPNELPPAFPLKLLSEETEFSHIIGVGSLDTLSNHGMRYVQLVAPTKTLVAAAFNGGHARGMGSSYAVPQVVAAAAMLANQGLTDPALIKARLIYTSDPVNVEEQAQWKGNIWGGLLNERRAVNQPEQSILIVPGAPEVERQIIVRSPDATIAFEGETEISYEGQNNLIGTVSFNQILRIIHFVKPDRTGRFLVMYLSNKGNQTSHFRMAWVDRLVGKIDYDWDVRSNINGNRADDKQLESRSLDVGDIQDYTAGIEYLRETQVTF